MSHGSHSPTTESSSPVSRRVLVVDDTPMLLHLMTRVAQSLGHEVRGVGSGEEAWTAFQSEPAELVVLDWLMPGIDGLEVCRRIRAHPEGEDVYVMLVTGRDAPEDLAAGLEAGADDYLTKPIGPEHLRARLVIAERRLRQTAARRSAEAALAQSQWLSGIGETTLALQHEINNPLAALLGNVSLIESGLVEPHELPEYMKVIAEQARRIAAVVKRLSSLRDPRSVEYVQGARMLDLRSGTPASTAPVPPPSSDDE